MTALERFCQLENRQMNCAREWCSFTCPVARYVEWLTRPTRDYYMSLIHREMPDSVKRAVISEALGEDLDVVQGKVKYLRKQMGVIDE